MATEKQIAANRENALKSTGPRTPVGKDRSRLNALVHGLSAESVIIGDEDPAEFDELRQAFHEEFDPQGALETDLVERLAGLSWQLRRISAFEAGMLMERQRRVEYRMRDDRFTDRGVPEDGISRRHLVRGLIDDLSHRDTLGKLARHEASLLSAFNKNLHLLMVMQTKRCEDDERGVTIEQTELPDAAE